MALLRTRVVGAVAAVVALGAAVTTYAVWPSHQAVSGRPVAVAPAPVASVPAKTDTRPHDFVAPAAPTSFVMAGPGLRIKAKVCKMDFVLPLDPPGDQFHTVCWVKRSFGVAPGSATNGTSYILGHAWAEAPLVLNPLSTLAMKQVNHHHAVLDHGVKTYPITNVDGFTITLGTPHGTLVYTVSRAFAVSKIDAIKVPSIMATGTPNRVVIITCGVQHGADIDDNVIVYADLTSSVAAKA